MAAIDCKICEVADRIYKQGDNILLMMRLTEDDGTIISDLSGYDIDIVVASSRAIYKKFRYRPEANAEANDISIDDKGYMAIHLPSDMTDKMLGRYSIEIALSSAGNIAVQKKVLATEIIPSINAKIRSL